MNEGILEVFCYSDFWARRGKYCCFPGISTHCFPLIYPQFFIPIIAAASALGAGVNGFSRLFPDECLVGALSRSLCYSMSIAF